MTELTNPIVAVDIGGTKISIAHVHHDKCLEIEKFATPKTGRGDDIVELISSKIENHIGPIGVATTGIVRDGKVTALNVGTLAIEDGYPLADNLSTALRNKVLVINDAQAAAWGEYKYGAGQGYSSIAFITASTGVGGGLVIDGRLSVGANGMAGHIGHFVVDPTGHRCGCGQTGCLETFASGTAIAREASRILGCNLSTQDVFAMASEDTRMDAIIESAAHYLAQAISNISAVVDVDAVILGGGVGLVENFKDRVLKHAKKLPEKFQRPILSAQTGADAGLIGVASLVAQNSNSEIL